VIPIIIMGAFAVGALILAVELVTPSYGEYVYPHTYTPRRHNRALWMIAALTAILFVLLIFAGAPGSHEGKAGAAEAFPTLYVDGDCESFRFIASQVWPEVGNSDVAWAKLSRIMRRESGCYSAPWGSNDGGTSFGLLQLHMPTRYWDVPMRTGFGPLNEECDITSRQELLNPAVNLRCARMLWLAFGWSPWS